METLSPLTISSCSVRCTPNFFSPIVRSLTQMPPSPFTSRTWNNTFSLCSCSGPPHMSHGWADWLGSECQSPTTGCRGTGLDGGPEEGSSACPLPPPGSTPRWVSSDRHWQNTSLSKGGINEPCWCIMRHSTLLATVQPVENLKEHLRPVTLYLEPWLPRHMSLHFSPGTESKSYQKPVSLQTRLFTTNTFEELTWNENGSSL